MSIFEELKAANFGEVEVPDLGLAFRIRKVNSRDLLAVKARHLAASLAQREGEEWAPETDPGAIAAQEAAALAEGDRYVQASVVAVRRIGAPEWEPLQIVADEADEDPAGVPVRMWVETLPIRVRVAIAGAAGELTLTAEGTRVVNSFRGGSVDPAVGGRVGEAVREVAP